MWEVIAPLSPKRKKGPKQTHPTHVSLGGVYMDQMTS